MSIPIGGLSLWLRADLGITDDGAGAVSSWQDQINGVLYSQSTGANAPLVTTDSLANSQTVLSFGNSTQRWLDCTTNPFYGSTAAEFCIVFRMRVYSPTDGNQTGAWIFSNTAGSLDHMTWTDGNVYTSWGTNTRRSITPGYSLSSAYRVWHIRSGRDNWEAWFPNGGYAKTARYWGNSTVSFINGTTTLGRSGSGTYFNGWIAEVVGANRFLSSEERGSLYHYFQTRYALPLVGATAPVSLSAVRVNVVRATNTTHLLAGSATGTLTESGTATVLAIRLLAGSVTGTLTDTGTLTRVQPLAGSLTGTLTSIGSTVGSVGLVGSSTGTLTTAGAAIATTVLGGSSSGTLSLAGAAAVLHPLAGTVTAAGTLTGALSVTHPLIGSSTGTATVSGVVIVTHPLIGSLTGTLTTYGDQGSITLLAGSTTGVLTSAGTVTRVHPLAGSASATGTSTGALSLVRGLAGSATGVLTTAGTFFELLRMRRDPLSDVSATGWTYVGAASHAEALANPANTDYSEAVTPSSALLSVAVEPGGVPVAGPVYVVFRYRRS